MKTITIANHKGGVGKTTTVHGLGDALSLMGYRVLLVDLDPQSTLTQGCGIPLAEPSLYEVFNGSIGANKAIYDVSNHDGTLHLLAGDIQLALTEKQLPTMATGYYVVRKQLRLLADHYDVCLIDCPPSLSGLTYNGLIASHGVIVPTMAQINDLRGLNLFNDTIAEMQENEDLNPNLQFIGVLLTMYDDRLLTHKEAIELIKQRYNILKTRITRSIRVAESPAIGESIVTYQPDSKQANQYKALAKEIKSWLENV